MFTAAKVLALCPVRFLYLWSANESESRTNVSFFCYSAGNTFVLLNDFFKTIKTNFMKKTILTFAVVASISTAAFNQGPILVWEENLGGTAVDVATSIMATPDGGTITGGYTNSNNGDVVGAISGTDAWILKLDASGQAEWKTIIGGTGDDYCYSVIRDNAGNYVFAGTTNSTNGDISVNLGGFDAWMVKLDASGNIIFSKTFGGSDDDAAYGVIQTIDLGYAFAGDSKSDMIAGNDNRGGYDCYVGKVNNAGSTVFQRLYGGSDDESLKSIAQTPNGDLYAAGETESNNFDVSGNHGGYDFYVLRMRKTGVLTWARTYGGTTNDNAHSIISSGKSIVIVGETESNNGDVPENNGGDDYWVLKIKITGATIFSKVFGGETSDIARSIINTGGGYIVVGESESASGDVSSNFGNDDYWFIKLSTNGNLMYEQNYGGAITDIAYAVTQTQDGNYVVAGASQSENVDVTDNNGNNDYWIIKLDNPDAKTAISDLPASSLLIYPNPTNGEININNSNNIASITIIDHNGKTLLSRNTDNTNVELDLSAYASGIYFIKIVSVDGSQQIAKIVKN